MSNRLSYEAIRSRKREEGFDLGDGTFTSQEQFKTVSKEQFSDPKIVYRRQNTNGKRNQSNVMLGDYQPSAFEGSISGDNNGNNLVYNNARTRSELLEQRHKDLVNFNPAPKSKRVSLLPLRYDARSRFFFRCLILSPTCSLSILIPPPQKKALRG